MSEPVLIVQNLTKDFFGALAVNDVSLSLLPGKTIALLGENGAGKSTLMKCISGVYTATSGTVLLDGKEIQPSNVRQAEALGILLVQQELHIAPNLSIAENACMGFLPNRYGVVDWAKVIKHTRDCLDFFEIDADPNAPASTLSASEQRLLMISSALTKGTPRVLILDEPTAALTPGEAAHLYDKIKQVSRLGVATVFITHRLDEIEGVCDRALVMRNGRLVFETSQLKGSRDEIVRAMIGREPEARESRTVNLSKKRLSVANLYVSGPSSNSKAFVDGASLHVSGGEIVGLFGLVGAGQTELAMAIFGAWNGQVEGEVTINGVKGRPRSPREALSRGCAMLTEDRKRSGLFETQSALYNMSAASISRLSRWGVIGQSAERRRNLTLARNFHLRPLNLEKSVETFSGGNQQKIMLARWLAAEPDLLIVDEPTVGVDIGARFEIYRILRELADSGKAILMISSDVEEVVNESDRILVMYKGQITGEFQPGVSRHTLLAAATGSLEETEHTYG
jgi:ABC-type sugar transport system ATPase subunit